MCNNFTGTPRVGQCKFVSKPVVLFYSAWNVLPVYGVQSDRKLKGIAQPNCA